MPKAIRDAPELWLGSRFYYDAFLKLSSCRVNGMGLGRIPWTACAEFASRHRLWGEEADILWAIIVEMDDAYMKAVSKDKKPAKDRAPFEPGQHSRQKPRG